MTTLISVDQIMNELRALGSDQTVKTYRNHGANGEMFGVKIGDLKRVLKKIKGNQQLALQLWQTGNSDAMYLAALAADGSQMTRGQLDDWAKSAWWYLLSEYAVPFVAAEHPKATNIAMKWIKSKKENVASSGWSTYGMAISILPDDALDLQQIRDLLKMVETNLDSSSNRIRYTMNGFVIAVGAYVQPLLKNAKATARRIGTVGVNVGKTSCKVPLATQAIAKIEAMGRVGKKRNTVKC